MVQPHELLGYKTDDPADVLACMHDRFCTLPPGTSAYDWEGPGRLLPHPPSVDGGPYTEIRLADTPEAAWAGEILQRAAASEQPMWQILKDLRRFPVYRVKAAGIRVKDCHRDSRLVGGTLALRKEGEEAQVHDEDRSLVALGGAAPSEGHGVGGTSMEWQVIDRYFREPIAAIFLPDDSPHPGIRLDSPVVASIPRLDALGEDGPLSLIYLGERRMRLRDLRHLADADGKPAGLRFARFLARGLAHDFLSPGRKRSIRDWVTLAVALLTSLGAIAGLALRLIDLVS